jgi:hypothetical protein
LGKGLREFKKCLKNTEDEVYSIKGDLSQDKHPESV